MYYLLSYHHTSERWDGPCNNKNIAHNNDSVLSNYTPGLQNQTHLQALVY